MRVVAYCRVSTNKEEQLDSLEAQQEFFSEYAKRNKYNLVHIYADEGKSGTKMKNRTQLLKLMSDANKNLFDIVLIKDVSRLARNVLDFLTSIRKLRSLGIRVVFVNYDQTDSESSEFMLTMLSAIAQEESANMSKRVKFGKKINAEKGRVPNLVYGYDKVEGDYFNLTINESEADVVRHIFNMYVEQELGAAKIATQLNQNGYKTKRNCNWTQTAISRIITNRLYIGEIINGKEEVSDFLTGTRQSLDEEKWLITKRPDLAIINEAIFVKANEILHDRQEKYKAFGSRKSEKNIFSQLIRCKECGAAFRRQVRSYKNTYIKWVCGGRNSKGVDYCPNTIVIDECELLTSITDYFKEILKDKKNVINKIVSEFNRQYKNKDDNQKTEKELELQLSKLKKAKEKYTEMYVAEIITMDELREKTNSLNQEIDALYEELKLVKNNITKSDLLQNILTETFKDIDKILNNENISHSLLARVIDKIEVDKDGNVDIYLKMFEEIGDEATVLLANNHTQGRN